MQTTQSNELYTDKGNYAVMTRTKVLKYAQLARIADQLCRNAEDLVSSMNPPSIDNRRIAGTMVGWAYNLAPMRIGTRFDY
ncbi:MAG: hypothetical protein ACLPH3_14625 [Terracidiphilus sp.]